MEQKELGEKIKSLRKERGMSQNALAELIDVTFQQVQKYENGQSGISVNRLHKIARAFDIPVTEFFTGEAACELGEENTVPGLLTAEERELLRVFRQIRSGKLKGDLITHLRNILDIESKDR